jgi:hypothetical protein
MKNLSINENESNNISPPEDVSDSPSNISKDDDFKFNYVCNVLREGLMDWNRDAEVMFPRNACRASLARMFINSRAKSPGTFPPSPS